MAQRNNTGYHLATTGQTTKRACYGRGREAARYPTGELPELIASDLAFLEHVEWPVPKSLSLPEQMKRRNTWAHGKLEVARGKT